jgi:hypothetical protein
LKDCASAAVAALSLSAHSSPVSECEPIIEAWRQICPDTSPDAFMFPTHGKGERAGTTVPRRAKSFLKWRIHPIAKKMNIPRRLVTFQVMRRTLGTDLQQHGTIKDAQGVLRHASIKTTGDVYVQQIPQSVRAAINSRTRAILARRRPVGERSEHATCPKTCPNWKRRTVELLEKNGSSGRTRINI